jgi:O-antigen/teichoic acid export membrane protein
MLRKAVPFGCLMVGFALYYRVDMIMLEWLRGPQEVGLYAAAYRFLDAVMLLAASLGGPFFPRFSNLIASNPGKVRELLEAMWRPLFALGLPLSLGVFLVSDQLVLVLFGREFAGAGRLTAVLIWGTLPLFWVNVANHALNAADRVWSLAAVYGISSMVNIAGNLILIPMFGGLGASLATLFCEWLNLVLIIGLIRRHFGVSFSAEGLWRYALASAGLACALWMTRGYGLAAELLLGGLAYVGGLFFLGYARSADMLAVKQLLIQ